MTRLRVRDDGIDVVGFLTQEELTQTLLAAKALVAPSIGGESFGMVLTRAFACATPVVASEIPGYREVMTPETSVAVPPEDPAALAAAVESLLADEPRRQELGVAARELAISRVRLAGHRRPARGRLRAGVGPAAGRGRGVSPVRLPNSLWFRFGFVLASLALAALLLWWRGPDWNSVYHAFDFVAWRWIVAAFMLNLVSVLLRAFSWRLTISQALDRPHPRFSNVLTAFGIGLFANAVLPGRIGELARVGVLRRHLPRTAPARAPRSSARCFAHRLFDVVPALLLVGYVLLTAKIPHWAVTSLVIVSTVGVALFGFAARLREERAPPRPRRARARCGGSGRWSGGAWP